VSFRRRHYQITRSALKLKPTTQDERVDAPSSVVFYDDVLDEDNLDGVVCARGLCVLADYEDAEDLVDPSEMSLADKVLNSYLGWFQFPHWSDNE
jgi:hypothetical protein